MPKKVTMNTGNYIEEMKENAIKLSMKCDVASEFHRIILEKYKYDYMDLERDEDGNIKEDENGDYIYREKTSDDWRFDEAMVAKELVKVLEKAIESFCFLD